MSESSNYSFSLTSENFASLASREAKEALLQWNLDTVLQCKRFSFHGNFVGTTSGDYEALLKEFLTSQEVIATFNFAGSASVPVSIDVTELTMNAMSMSFFDKLKETDVITPSGNIRGCFDEIFDGITVGDKLREMLINEDSENAYVFDSSEKRELLYSLFKVLCVGGSMCQPDTTINRYLETTKTLYKDLTTIFRESATGQVKLSGRAFLVNKVDGLSIFPTEDNMHNTMIVIVDPLKKFVTTVYKPFVSFW